MLITRIADRRLELGVEPEEAFVWALRLRRLQALKPPEPLSAEAGPWPELVALAPADAASGWAIWCAHRRAVGAPVIPPGAADQRLTQWLSRLRRTWLTREELAAADFPDPAAAGLGAIALAPGPALDRHFTRWPSPPVEPRWQEMWLRGRLRADGWPAAATEAWAARHDLHAANRVRLWRRASEERLLHGQWREGLADLGSGFAAAGASSEGAADRRDLAIWARQAVALAIAHDRWRDAAAITALVRAKLPPAEWRSWAVSVSTLRRRPAGIAAAPAPGVSVEARAAFRVRSGLAPRVGLPRPGAPGVLASPPEETLWRCWARWGLALAARDGRLSSLDARACDYHAALAGLLAAPRTARLRNLGCAAVAHFLRGHPAQAAVLDWLLDRDICRLTRGALPPSPLSFFRRARAGTTDWAMRHALLGACLAAGDLQGQLLLARDLPTAGLPEADRLRLLYPVPASGPLLAALAEARVEEPLLLALVRNESLFDLAARSGAGALGILQIMPFHYRERGLERDRPRWREAAASVRLGAGLLTESARAYDGDPYRTVAAYNAGAEAVARWTRQLGGKRDRDLFLSWIGYAETRGYVEKVLIDREIYGWILGGGQNGSP